MSSLAFWADDEVDKVNRYQIKVSTNPAGQTVAVVANEQGKVESSPTAQRILTLLHEQIR